MLVYLEPCLAWPSLSCFGKYLLLKQQLANTSTDINHKYFFVIFDLKSAHCIYGKYAKQQKSLKNLPISTVLILDQDQKI